MILKNIDDNKVSRLISLQQDNVTCIECCKFFSTPETAPCGHSLCCGCWHGRRSCPVCAKPFKRKTLQPNSTLKSLTEHVKKLIDTYEIFFKVKLDEFVFDTPMKSSDSKDPTKHVKAWLANSQNHFSAPPPCSQQSTPDVIPPIELSKNNLQIHGETLKKLSPKKVIHIPPPQDDWDKIEEVPDTEDIIKTNKENIAGPMDLEPFYFEDIEYSTENPRRSSRKRDLGNDTNSKLQDVSTENQFINSSTETDHKAKLKQNWSNVKRMRKEFSKLNKMHKNKLNVSIEICKKNKSVNKVPQPASPNTQQTCIVIDDNTPDVGNIAIKQNTIEPIREDHEPDRVEHVEATTNNTSSITFTNTNGNIQQKICDSDNVPIKGNASVEKPINCENRVSFIHKSNLHSSKNLDFPTVKPIKNHINLNSNVNTDDIEISIKIGNTITNIMIKRNDVSLKVNTDKEIQTSLPPQVSINQEKIVPSQKDDNIVHINLDKIGATDSCIKTNGNNAKHGNDYSKKGPIALTKSIVSKKHTDSADTATVQFDITESVEKEMSNIMEDDNKKDSKNNEQPSKNTLSPSTVKNLTQLKNKMLPSAINKSETNAEVMEDLNELDIFASGSVKEAEVQLLKSTINTPSEIFKPTAKSYRRTQRTEKRPRDDIVEEITTSNKKKRCNKDITEENFCKETEQDSENMNYETIMGKVFANIDADIDEIQKSQKTNKTSLVHTIQESQYSQMMPQTIRKLSGPSIKMDSIITQKKNEKYSENIFSLIEKDTQERNLSVDKGKNKVPGPDTQKHIDHLLTPVLCEDLAASEDHTQIDEKMEIADEEPSTPCQEVDDSDKSVVEETPQKNTSFSKLKHANHDRSSKSSSYKDLEARKSVADIENISSGQKSKSTVNLTDSVSQSNKTVKNVTAIENQDKSKQVSETPLTINKFFDHIKHNSTPVARKSLNFNSGKENDDDQTLCTNTTLVAKTTQEKEFMSKAFEKTPPPLKKCVSSQSVAKKTSIKYYIAGSCLTPGQITNIKLLCIKYNWVYLDKYSKVLTHLVVGVDEEQRAQRSVKYMCALAAGKWIVSYNWIEECLVSKKIVEEDCFEALDSTGDPGPQRSRVATSKLFEGITFFCMQPHTVLNAETLQEMLVAAGGRVVKTAAEVRVKDESPCLLLAEPEHTQEDKFIYMAMELGIVPVNYEWALNSLGCYCLFSIQDLLLCPAALLPPLTKKWPPILIAREFDSFS